MPEPAPDEPTDDEILRFVDGAGTTVERRELALRILLHQYSQERVEILADALGQSLVRLLPPLPKA